MVFRRMLSMTRRITNRHGNAKLHTHKFGISNFKNKPAVLNQIITEPVTMKRTVRIPQVLRGLERLMQSLKCLKPGLHEPQLPVEWSAQRRRLTTIEETNVTLLSTGS